MPFCEKCGKELHQESSFCENCGAPVLPPETPETPECRPTPAPKAEESYTGTLPEGIYRCADGVLRWEYDMSLWKNPTVLITLLKVFGGVVAGMSVLMFFILLGDGAAEAFAFMWKFLLGGLTLMYALCLIGYAVYTLINGGRYCVVFEMDERGVTHRQLDKQFKRDQAVAMVAVAAGVSKGKPSMVGGGILAASRQSMHSSFPKVKKVLGKPARGVIYVNESLNHNQIYVTGEQYGFVLDYIRRHCRENISFSG